MARLLGRTRDDLEQLALASAPGAGGVVLLPYFDGERTPNLPDATGTLHGLRSDTEPAQLARAAYEGVVCGLLDALDALLDAGVTDRRGPCVRRRRRCPVRWSTPSSSPTCCSVRSSCRHRPSTSPAARACRLRPPSPDATSPDVAREWAPTDGRLLDPDPTVDARRRARGVPATSSDAPIPSQETDHEPHLLQRRLARPPEGEPLHGAVRRRSVSRGRRCTSRTTPCSVASATRTATGERGSSPAASGSTRRPSPRPRRCAASASCSSSRASTAARRCG